MKIPKILHCHYGDHYSVFRQNREPAHYTS